ncbi:MAG: PQ-loop repeat-containing protein [Boseongicola sp.]|nr:PQ-loop repeat-containing protein [Boseongicola sp.]
MEMEFIEILGFAAGATTLVSSVPQLIANLRNQELARGQSLSRNCLQSAGNALWFVYGASVGSASMLTFAALGCLMASCLALQAYLVQQKSAGREYGQKLTEIGVAAA